MNTRDLLQRTCQALASAGLDEAPLEAEVLLRHVLRLDRATFYAAQDDAVAAPEQQALEALVSRRLRREPLAYILGEREFYGLAFRVSPAVMVPRPETELVVDLALEWATRRTGAAIDIVDVGTGSGCIAVSLAVHLPGARVFATDISREALAVARENCCRHWVADRVHLLQGNLLAPLSGKIDLIIANLPYIPERELPGLQPEVRLYEPRQALTPGPDGSALVRRLLADGKEVLKPAGALLLEIHPLDRETLSQAALRYFPDASVRVVKDPAGWDRALVVAR